ncbi:VOC family protein [Leeuwenhoekiella sp. A16]|uniref:VOC family protein n=1 Tax=unclassified Leeuwenhoekiella TaxID=2615029 RepID=UPI003A805514
MKQKIRTFFTFFEQAETAMNFYISLFDDAAILSIERYKAGEAGKEGSVIKAVFHIKGQEYMCIDSPIKHDFTFTPAISLFVNCDSQEEIERLSEAFNLEGKFLMPLDNYGFSQKFCWVQDKFGVSWQLNFE